MSPFRSLLFILCVLTFLFLIAWAVPAGGIHIGKLELNFPTLQNILNPENVEYADITKIISDTTQEKTDSTLAELKEIPDSLFAQTISDILHPLQCVDSPGTALWPFYEQLLNNKGLIRVIHYGDSQIEGDRITGYLRQRFQERFGGGGVGYIPAVKVENVSLAVEIENTGDWKRYTIYGKRDTSIQHKKYGFAGSFARFSPLAIDSAHTKDPYEASLMISPNSSSYKNCFAFDKFKLLLNTSTKPVIAELSTNDSPADFKILSANEGYQVAEWDIPQNCKQIKLDLTSELSPDILGMFLDKSTGIAFDNIPMRGSSGTDFTRMDFSLLSNIYKDQNVGLLIYEFGVNVVPGEKDDYSFYENWVYSQLVFLKKLTPNVCILVIGVSDMSKKSGENYVSWPNIVKIRDAQKKAAFRAGCAFWDMYEAMGGENSMPSWVNADPPLAGPDYTHFNPNGARIIARLLYKAMMYDYETYARKHPPVQTP
ncbi:MAG: hypothetical protein CVU05_01410 [Bacteroidetes bacterium HGW-Bacteroidetes-21]|jgi:hypothetical protein|nr:MAG: hypothetical protein CVU05_01410 [Bacteroidetes bacterium HGW-Bacteroidetes-21]